MSRELYAAKHQPELGTSFTGLELQIYSQLERDGYFNKPELPAQSQVIRAFVDAWTPVVVMTGDLKITSPVITAVRKRNPLALLNPVVFQMSW